MNAESASPRAARAQTIGWCLLFGTVYFIQGIGEPTEGLIAQPVRSLMKSWGQTPGQIAQFFGLLALPWSIKPLYGLFTDFIPILGLRRKSYLVLTSSAASLGLGYVYFFPPQAGQLGWLMAVLLVPTVGVAFSDVVIDALMVEKGQPRGLTGVFQSVQWASIYGATILTGVLGGYLSEFGLQRHGFLICSVATLGTLAMTLLFVREQERGLARPATEAGAQQPTMAAARASPAMVGWGAFRKAAVGLWAAARSPAVLWAGGFIFAWNFNPFSSSVQYTYLTGPLGLSEQFYGYTVTAFAVGSVLAALLFGFICRRLTFPQLLNGSIAMGIASTILYVAVWDKWSALGVSFVVGFTYMLGLLVLLDLAARVCPPIVAGTTFALLMSISNFSTSLSTACGGWAYDHISPAFGQRLTYMALVAAGCACTALGWLLVPWLLKLERGLKAVEEAA